MKTSIVLTLVIILALVISVWAAPALAHVGTLPVPPPTLDGSFEGTWYYVDPGYNVALFIWREQGELRTRYQVRTRKGLEYATDPGGYARVLHEGSVIEVLFKAAPVPEDPSRLEGTFERISDSPKGDIAESGEFRIHRAEGGRKLVLVYPEYSTVITPPSGKVVRSSRTDVLLLFRKASDIVIGFDEIPF